MNIRALSRSYPDSFVVSAAALCFSAMLGLSILLLPFYVSCLLFALLMYSVLLMEKPVSILYAIAFFAPQVNLMVTRKDVIGAQYVYDNNNFLLVDFFVLAAFAVMAYGRASGRIGPLSRRRFDLPLFFFTMYAAASLVWARDLTDGIFILLQIFSCVILFYAPIILLKEKKSFQIFLWIWLIISTYVAVLAISTLYVSYKPGIIYRCTQMFDDNQFGARFVAFVFERIKKRVGGVADPNRVAHYLNTAFLAGLVLYLHTGKRLLKIVIGVVMFFLLYTIVHTLSKAGLGSLLIVIACYIGIHKRFEGKFFKMASVFIVSLFACVVLMSVIDLSGGLGRLGEAPTETNGHMSLALRLKWWRADLKVLFATDGAGAGVGGIAGHPWSYAQSLYFSILADFGLIGFLLAAYFLFAYAYELYALLKRSDRDNFYFSLALMAAGCVVLFFIHAVVDFAYNLRLPWLMAGLAIASAEAGQRATTEDEGLKS